MDSVIVALSASLDDLKNQVRDRLSKSIYVVFELTTLLSIINQSELEKKREKLFLVKLMKRLF